MFRYADPMPQHHAFRRRAASLASLALVAFVACVVPVTEPVSAAPPPGSSGTASAPGGAQDIADEIRKQVRSKGKGRDAAQLLKAFGLDPSDPASTYLADAQVLDGLRRKPPLPAMSASKQNEALAEVYLSVRMQGKGVDQVEKELDRALEYATGKRPLHELNVPESERERNKACPHDRCTGTIRLQGRVMFGGKNYDQYSCPQGHETLLRVN